DLYAGRNEAGVDGGGGSGVRRLMRAYVNKLGGCAGRDIEGGRSARIRETGGGAPQRVSRAHLVDAQIIERCDAGHGSSHKRSTEGTGARIGENGDGDDG